MTVSNERKNFFSGRTASNRSSSWDKPACEYHSLMMNHFLSLVGGVVDYYGADGAEHEFKIDKMVFKVLEDPDDGYRSMLGAVEYGEDTAGIFFPNPIAKVMIEEFEGETCPDGNDWLGTGSCEGYRLRDVEDGHIWLEFGTANTNDYYPYFVFRHVAKPPPHWNPPLPEKK